MAEDRVKVAKLLALKIRKDVLEELLTFGSGHVGGSLSVADVLAVLYSGTMRVDPKNPHDPNRDRLILSKGHAGPAWYAALAENGFIPLEELKTLNQSHTNLPSHPDKNKTPGVDATTGSLGQGTSVAAGIAYGLMLQNSDAHTYLICGDGELDEGQCWEAFQFIVHYNLHNLTLFIDMNKKQLDGYTKDIMNLQSVSKKMHAFGFNTIEVDGQDVAQIINAIEQAHKTTSAPTAIVLSTTKGAGVTYFADLMNSHSVQMTGEAAKAAQAAIEDFSAQIQALEA